MNDTSTVALVRAAKNPQEAMLAIATALDKLLGTQATPDPWGEWGAIAIAEPDHPFQPPPDGTRTEITGDETHTEVVIPPPSEERKAARDLFERQRLKLAETIEGADPNVDYNEAYQVGGPRWLYYGNRELVMTYPDETRRLMVLDIEQDSPEEAQEIARDILKEAAESGPTSVGMGTDLMSRMPR